jgi:hypothetical protein
MAAPEPVAFDFPDALVGECVVRDALQGALNAACAENQTLRGTIRDLQGLLAATSASGDATPRALGAAPGEVPTATSPDLAGSGRSAPATTDAEISAWSDRIVTATEEYRAGYRAGARQMRDLSKISDSVLISRDVIDGPKGPTYDDLVNENVQRIADADSKVFRDSLGGGS